MAPIEVPVMISGLMPFWTSVRMTPIWAKPRAAPPESASPIDTDLPRSISPTPVASSAALGPRERKFRFRRADEIIMIAGARDRPHRGGVELAVLDEMVVDINADHLSEHDVT